MNATRVQAAPTHVHALLLLAPVHWRPGQGRSHVPDFIARISFPLAQQVRCVSLLLASSVSCWLQPAVVFFLLSVRCFPVPFRCLPLPLRALCAFVRLRGLLRRSLFRFAWTRRAACRTCLRGMFGSCSFLCTCTSNPTMRSHRNTRWLPPSCRIAKSPSFQPLCTSRTSPPSCSSPRPRSARPRLTAALSSTRPHR